jgi:hypothetical protein
MSSILAKDMVLLQSFENAVQAPPFKSPPFKKGAVAVSVPANSQSHKTLDEPKGSSIFRTAKD